MRGLSGIPPVKDNIIRPVMCLSRGEIEEITANRQVAIDESNFQEDYTRNKLRLKMMPLISEINENAFLAVSQSGFRTREENTFIEQAVENVFENKAFFEGEILCFNVKDLKEQINEIVVVASAMGKTTNELLKKAFYFTDEPDKREIDMLISTGEQQSISLLSVALNSIVCKAIS